MLSAQGANVQRAFPRRHLTDSQTRGGARAGGGGAASLGANRWCVWGAGGPVMGKSQYHKATNWLGFFSEIDKAS